MSRNTNLSMEAICKERMERTIKLEVSTEGRPYGRKDVLDGLLDAGCPRDAIEALGVRERNVEWEITLKTTSDRDQLLRLPSIVVKGYPAAVSGIRKAARRLRVFYLPFYVPITAITDQLERDGVKVKKLFQDKDRETGLLSNVWNLLVETDNVEMIPDRMRWSFAGVVGSVLVNMAGRPPKCLRCQERGHRKFECTAPYCHRCRKVGHAESDACPTQTYAARVRRAEPADEDAMDDPCDETAVLQPSTNRSWAEQMDELEQQAAPSGARSSTEAPAEAAAESTAETATETATDSTTASAAEPAAESATKTETMSESATESESAAEPAMETTDDAKDGDGGWTMQEGRKRHSSASPSSRAGKARTSMSTTPVNPTTGRRRTQPTLVSGRVSAAKNHVRS